MYVFYFEFLFIYIVRAEKSCYVGKYLDHADASQAMPLYYLFRWNEARCHCIIFQLLSLYFFRGLPAKGKRSVHPNFAKILVLGRLGCVIVLFFRLGQPGNVIVLFFLGRASWPIPLYYSFSARFGQAGPLYYFFGAGKIK